MLGKILKNPLQIIGFYQSFYTQPKGHMKKWNLSEKLVDATALAVIIQYSILFLTSLLSGGFSFVSLFLTPLMLIIASFIFSSIFFIVGQILNIKIDLKESWVLHQYIFVAMAPISALINLFSIPALTFVPLAVYVVILVYFVKVNALHSKK